MQARCCSECQAFLLPQDEAQVDYTLDGCTVKSCLKNLRRVIAGAVYTNPGRVMYRYVHTFIRLQGSTGSFPQTAASIIMDDLQAKAELLVSPAQHVDHHFIVAGAGCTTYESATAHMI